MLTDPMTAEDVKCALTLEHLAAAVQLAACC